MGFVVPPAAGLHGLLAGIVTIVRKTYGSEKALGRWSAQR